VLAAPLADVLVRDLDPAVVVRVGDHPLDERAVVLLDIHTAGKLGPRVCHAVGKPVADPLEVADAEHARATRGGHAPLEVATRERGGEDLGQLALEAGDLAAKLGAGGSKLDPCRRA
jgi:hypothetical protein